MKPNRFATFADEDTQVVEQKVQQAAKPVEPKKKITVKVAKAPIAEVEGAEEFEKVQDRSTPATRGGERGGRGGRGGDRRGGHGGDRGGERGDRGGRGGRGGRGSRPEGGAEGGERRGRGRGERPRTAVASTPAGEGETEVLGAEVDVKHEERRGGRGPRFEGKPREHDHPYDRHDGTGRGKRGDKKGGFGKGNWGKPDGEAVQAEGAETTGTDAPVRRERKPREPREPREPKEPREPREPREPKVEEVKVPEVIEEEVGFTLDDYEAQKKAKSQGLYKKVEGRQHEKIDAKNIKESEFTHNERQTTFQTQLTSGQSYAVKANENAQLFGF